MITEKEINATLLSPTKKDYYQVWQELLDVAGKLSERWDPSSTNEADPGIVLLKVLTGITDKLNYTIDKNILEVYMPSAAQEESMRRLCDMLGYSMKYYQSATTDVTIYYDGEQSDWESDTVSGVTNLILPIFTQIKNIDGDIIYTTLENKTFTKANNLITVPCIEGTVQACAEDNDGIITVDNLDDDFRYYLPSAQIAENGVFVYNIANGTQSTLWTQVDNLNTQALETKVYKFGYDSQEMIPYLQFPADIASLIKDGLQIYYTLTSGVYGNISANTLSTFTTPEGWTITDDVTTTTYNTTGKTHTADEFKCYNASATTNGANKETLNSAYNNFKKTIGTFDTLVTCRDYMNKIYSLTVSQTNKTPLVSNIIVSDLRDDINKAVTLCSFNGYGISYADTPLVNYIYDKTVDVLPTPTEACYNKTYKCNNKYFKCVKTSSDGSDFYFWGEINDNTTLAINNFDLILYPFKTVYGLNTKSEYDNSFKYDNSDTINSIKEQLDDYKTISHELKLPTTINLNDTEHTIICIKNYLRLNAKITTTTKITTTEWQSILANIKTALYKNFNLRQLDFSEQIPFDTILDVLQSADIRIKNVALDDPDLYTAIMLDDNTEYFILDDDADDTDSTIISKFTTAELKEYSKADTQQKENIIQAKKLKAKELYNKLVLRNILAGRVQLFNYESDFSANITEKKNTTYDLVYPTDKTADTPDDDNKTVQTNKEIKYINSELIIKPETSVNNYDQATDEDYDSSTTTVTYDKTLGDNEVIQFRAPNFVTTTTYASYSNYYLKLNRGLQTYAVPATFTTLYDYFNKTWTKYPALSETESDTLQAAYFTQLMNENVGDLTASKTTNSPLNNLVIINDESTFNIYKERYGGAFLRDCYKKYTGNTIPSDLNNYKVLYNKNKLFYDIKSEYRYIKENGKYTQDDLGDYLLIFTIDEPETEIYLKISDNLYEKAEDPLDAPESKATVCNYKFVTNWADVRAAQLSSNYGTGSKETMFGQEEQLAGVATNIDVSDDGKSTDWYSKDITDYENGKDGIRRWVPNQKDKYAKCYISSSTANSAGVCGWSKCITGEPTHSFANVLANCVGYACGRFREILYTNLTAVLQAKTQDQYTYQYKTTQTYNKGDIAFYYFNSADNATGGIFICTADNTSNKVPNENTSNWFKVANFKWNATKKTNELIIGNEYDLFNCTAKDFVYRAQTKYPELTVSDVPAVGAIMVWTIDPTYNCGHVAIVEKVNYKKDSDGKDTTEVESVYVSESMYGHEITDSNINCTYKNNGSSWGLYGSKGAYGGVKFILNPVNNQAIGELGTHVETATAQVNIKNGTFKYKDADGNTTEQVMSFTISDDTGGALIIDINPADGYEILEKSVDCSSSVAKIIEATENQVIITKLFGNETITITCIKKPNVYLYPLNAKTYNRWYTFIQARGFQGIYKTTGSSQANQIGNYVDEEKYSYLLSNYCVSVDAPMTSHYVPQIWDSNVATTATNGNLTYGHTKDGLGSNGIANYIKADAEYQLQEGEYLCINYTAATMEQSTTDTSTTQTTSTIINNYYGPNTIIKVNFDLYPSDVYYKQGNSYSKTSGYDFKKYIGTSLGNYGLPGMYTLGAQDQIEIRELATSYIYAETNTVNDSATPIYVYFKLNNESSTEDVQFLGAEGTATDSYTLQEGEYFWYTDKDKKTLNWCGNGCKITNHSQNQIIKQADSANTTTESIFENGSTAIPWIPVTGLYINDPENPTKYDNYLEWCEYQYLNLTASDELYSINFSNEAIQDNYNLNSTWKTAKDASYRLSNITGTLPEIQGENIGTWEVRTKLVVNMNSINGQTLDENSHIRTYSSDPRIVNADTVIDITDDLLYTKNDDSTYTQDNNGKYLKYNNKYYDLYDTGLYNFNIYNNTYKQTPTGTKWFTGLIEDFSNISLKSNYVLNTSADLIQLIFETTTGEIIANAKIKAYDNLTIYKQDNNGQPIAITMNNINDNYTKIIFDGTCDSENPYLTMYCALRNAKENYGLIMLYYSTTTNKAEDMIKIKITNTNEVDEAPKIFNYPNILAETWWPEYIINGSYYLKPGLNILKLNNDCSIKLYKGVSSDDNIILDTLKIIKITDNDFGINTGLLGYYNITPDETTSEINQTNTLKAIQLLNDINSLDTEHKFYYNMTIDDSLAININALAGEHLQLPAMLYDYNNVNNKFVISELDSDYFGTGITLARSSLKQ